MIRFIDKSFYMASGIAKLTIHGVGIQSIWMKTFFEKKFKTMKKKFKTKWN